MILTRRDSIKKAITHEPQAAVPYAINLTGQGYSIYGKQLLEQYASSQIMQDLQDGWITFEQAVSLAIGNYMLYVYAPWWNWAELGPEFAEEDTPSVLPDTIGTGSYEDFFRKVTYIREHYDVYILVTIWGSHWEKAYFSRGIQNFLCDLAADPEWSQELLNLIIRKNLVMLENILTCKAIDGILLGSDWGTQRDLIMSPQCFRTMIKPGEIQEYELIKKYKKDVFVHSCGNVERIMDDLVEMGVDALNPVQPECMDLRWIQDTYGEDMVFYGGISTQKTLPYGTPAEVEAEVNQIIQIMNQHHGYITAPSQEIQEDVPYENLIALIETAKKWTNSGGTV